MSIFWHSGSLKSINFFSTAGRVCWLSVDWNISVAGNLKLHLTSSTWCWSRNVLNRLIDTTCQDFSEIGVGVCQLFIGYTICIWHSSQVLTWSLIALSIYWGVCGVMVTVLENEYNDLSSNSGQFCLHFT